MANLEVGTSSDAAPASEDVGVRVFRDDDELRVGEVVGENLLSAINNSKIYIPIFSQTYASSKWCLSELAHIVDNVSKLENEKCILPIFLGVEPDDVKLKTPIYTNALLEQERKFPGKVKAWRAALVAVGKIKGWNVTSSQAAIVRLVVGEVLEKLKVKLKLVTEHLIGLDDQVKDLTEFLDVNHDDVRLIGIYGMGGIGKTTIAKVVFNQLCSYFGKCCSFLEGVRETSIKEGIVPLQKKLLYDIGCSTAMGKIDGSEEGIRRITATLRNKKVLVVLDDVDKKLPIKNLLGNSKLNRGSRIIITTRDRDILQVEGSEVKIKRYEMQTMDDSIALKLFCRHAFQKDYPLNDYLELSREIVSLMGGLPLAIEVVGSLLKNKKDKNIWGEKLVKLREVPKEEILEKLRISYDDLDEFQKKIFLDIACFFNEKKTDAIYMWESCKFYPREGIEVLSKRCLIKILDNDKFWIHDQLIALGKEIVRVDSQCDLRKQSRLWNPKEALQIIRTKERKDKVQALQINGWDGSIEITNEEFERFPNLRLLTLWNGTYVGEFARCHSNLRWFSWSFPSEKEFGANNLYMDQLVVCKLHGINFKDDSKAWDLIKRARNLKVLSITQCSSIMTIPDISKCLSLKRLTLANCSSLKRIESFIGNLQSLIELNIEWCSQLIYLPKDIGALVKLQHFSLLGCCRLRELPGSIGNLTSLTKLDLSETIIRELPNSIEKLKSLRILRVPINRKSSIDCKNHVEQLPSGINTLINLEELDLSRHNVTDGVSVRIRELSSLRILNLESTGICKIPRTINMLHHLQTLNLSHCHEIQELPELPTSLTCLHLESESLLSVPNLSNLTNLVILLLSNYKFLGKKSKPLTGCNLRWIGRLSRLKRLDLDLLDVPAPPQLASLSHLEKLVLRHLNLKPLMQLTSSDWNLRNLSSLKISCCEVKDVPLKVLPHMKKIIINICEQLQILSIPLELRKLQEVEVSDCLELVEIQVVGLLKLKFLKVCKCKSLTRICGLSYLKSLEALIIEGCEELANVEGIDELESLISLEVKRCMSLRWSIDASCPKMPNDCLVNIKMCGDSIKNSSGRIPLKHYKEEILLNTSNKMKPPFTIDFFLKIKQFSHVIPMKWSKKWTPPVIR